MFLVQSHTKIKLIFIYDRSKLFKLSNLLDSYLVSEYFIKTILILIRVLYYLVYTIYYKQTNCVNLMFY